MKRSIEYLYVELPQCNTSPNALLSQKVKIIVAIEKDLEETIEKMDAEHKAHTIELEDRVPRTPPEEHEARVAKL